MSSVAELTSPVGDSSEERPVVDGSRGSGPGRRTRPGSVPYDPPESVPLTTKSLSPTERNPYSYKRSARDLDCNPRRRMGRTCFNPESKKTQRPLPKHLRILSYQRGPSGRPSPNLLASEGRDLVESPPPARRGPPHRPRPEVRRVGRPSEEDLRRRHRHRTSVDDGDRRGRSRRSRRDQNKEGYLGNGHCIRLVDS